ncbi:MAG: polysaccharide biosynthesis/export family protein [Syntrophobacteraceae bacterium]|nr:polysaccharide export protein [Desulfobacteraceae bacterium]
MWYRLESHGSFRWCRLLPAILGLSAFLSGCSTDGPKPTTDLQSAIARESAAQERSLEYNSKLFASLKDQPKADDYVLREGDLLQVTVYGENDLAGEGRIGAEGTITLPLIGVLNVRGLSAREAEHRIQQAYEKKYLRDPRVRIFVKEQQGSKITLLGQLNKPGTYDYYSTQRLMYVLSMGGGLSEKAGQVVQVSRSSGNPDQPNTYFIDLDRMINKGESALNMEIQGGDVVYVPQAGTVYIDGAVKNRGTYPIKTNMTIQEAIVAAGGLRAAKKDGVKLARLKGNGDREVMQFNIDDIQQGQSGKLPLRDHDIIFVESNKLEAFLYSIRFSVGDGLFGVGFSPPPY